MKRSEITYPVPLTEFEWELVQVGLMYAGFREDHRKMYTKLSQKIGIKLLVVTKEWAELKCGCLITDPDGSKIACWKHTSKKLKRALKKSVRVR